MPAPVLDRLALAEQIHRCLEERDGRFYATPEGAELLTGWLRGQGFPSLVARVDEHGRFKIGYKVTAAQRPGVHLCHWPGCPVEVPPSMWGCKPHWFRLPVSIRSRLWHTYRPGQEDDKKPSPEYLAAARVAQEWALDHPERPARRRNG